MNDYAECGRILDLLAKKISSSHETWCNARGKEGIRACCNLCGLVWANMERYGEKDFYLAVRAHGMEHLKERNLLAFV